MKKEVVLFTLFLITGVLLFILSVSMIERENPEKILEKTNTDDVLISPLPPTERILFVSNMTGNNDIYLMDLLSKHVLNLTHNAAQDMNPQPSSDGKYIVFYSDRDGDNEIYRMTLTTGEIRQLTHNISDDYDPSYTKDGKNILFKSTKDDQKGDIFIMNEDGSEVKNITPKMEDTEEWDPVENLDGNIIFVQRKTDDHLTDDIFMIDKNGDNLSRLSRNSVPDWYPSVNPRSYDLVYVSRDKADSKDSIYTMQQNGVNKTRLTFLPGNSDDPSYNTTGKKIIFINDNGGNYDIFLMDTSGGNIEKIYESTVDELSPVFLP
ncbi:MAG: PD40 domain-containing protein [Candidatus Levybacteria bacterium]|nr:PD40 domain-containing protein [Candidatus Levybacteria bacterium]MBP9814956.1 PD40 domain-containing protein [Candidatus Levybacteria bacterium]